MELYPIGGPPGPVRRRSYLGHRFKGQCSGCGDSDRGRMFFHGNRAYRTSRLAETQHVVRPSGRIRPVFHIVPLPSRVRRNRSGSLRVRHGVHEPVDAGSNGQSGIQRRRLGERNARQRKSISSWTAAPHVLQAVPCLRNIDRNRPRHGGPDLGQQWNPDKHVHDHLPNSALEQVH